VTAKKFFTSKVKNFSLRGEKNRVTANFFSLPSEKIEKNSEKFCV